MDIYSIGEMVIDWLPGKEANSYVRNAGGAPANVAIAAARLGMDVGMCCSVGDDDFGHFLMDTLKENHVRRINPDYCQKAVTTMAFVSLAANGERTFTFVRNPGADMFLSPACVREEDIRSSVIVHAGSCSLSAQPESESTARAMGLASWMKKIVSFDVNYRDLMWNCDRAACVLKLRELLPMVDMLKISEEEVDMIGGDGHILELMETYHITLVVETLSSEGARAFFQGHELRVPGRKVPCVDATGAGDAFWGGFLANLRMQGVEHVRQLTDTVVQKAMAYGNAAGSICVQNKGAIPSLPTRDMIEALL